MAINVVSSQPDTFGYILCATSADANAGEVILAGTAATKIKVRHVTMTNNTAGALTFTLEDSGAALIGPLEIGANTSIQWDFNPMMALTTNQDLEITADAGAITVFVQGVQE